MIYKNIYKALYLPNIILKPVLFFTVILVSYNCFSQPIANFNTSVTSGCFPLTVSFQDLSTGNPTTYQWSFGNGTNSNVPSPSVTYFTPGTYTISLTVSNSSGSNTMTKTNYITVYNNPTINFSASSITGCFPFIANFTDQSVANSGTISNWNWYFGNGDTSTLQIPMEMYNNIGSYTVSLRVTNSVGCSSILLSKPNYINVTNGVTTNFSSVQQNVCKPPTTVTFSNTSTGPGTLSYQWNFGDGSNSVQQNPAHPYTATGTYSVSLITKSSIGCVDTLVKTNYITVTSNNTSFSMPGNVCIGNTINLVNTSNPSPVSSYWDFGDSTSSTLLSPTHIWNIPRTYNVKLVNTYSNCTDSATQTTNVLPLPAVNFTTVDTFSCAFPYTVNFTDQTHGATQWLWNFGDGTTSTLENPSHTYNTTGKFNVTLTATNANNCSNTLTKNNVVNISPLVAKINGTPTGGCAPFTFKPTANFYNPNGISSYLWNFGDGTTSNLASPVKVYANTGVYVVNLTLTTNDGCTASTSSTDTVKVDNPLSDAISASPLVQCAGNNITFKDSPSVATSWLWKFGDGGSSALQNPIHAYNQSGKFNITLIVSNNYCKDTIVDSNYITILPPVSKMGITYSCTNKLQVIFADLSTQPLTWTWNFGDGTTSNQQNPPIHTYSSLGSYKVTLVTTNGSCSSTSTTTIKLANEQADFTPTQSAACLNSILTFSAINSIPGNIINYTWNFGDGTQASLTSPTTTHSYSKAGSYTVKLTITDLHGCKDSMTIPNYVTIESPKASFSLSSLTACKSSTVSFTDQSITDGVHPITTWLWNYGDGNSQSQSTGNSSHIYPTAGYYTPSLKITDNLGCSDSTTLNSPLIIDKVAAVFTSIDSSSCTNTQVTLTNSSFGTGPLSYLWDLGNNASSTDSTASTMYTTDGSYTVKLVVTDSLGCKDSLIKPNYINIETIQAAFSQSDSTILCFPYRVSFTNNSVNYTSQLWDFGDGSTSTLVSPSHVFAVSGTYNVKLIVYGPGGCIDSTVHQVKQNVSVAQLTYSPVHGCDSLTANFQVKITIPVLTFVWVFGDGNTLSTNDSNITNVYTTQGTYLPSIILLGLNGCQIPIPGSDSIHITLDSTYFNSFNTSICLGKSISFNDSSITNTAITNWNWDFGDGNTSSSQNPVYTYSNTGLYNVKLVTTTNDGCVDSLTKSNFIRVNSVPKIGISGDSSGCVPLTLNFTGLNLQPDTSTLSWNWTFGNGNTSNMQIPSAITYNTAGNYITQLIVNNLSGCSDTASKSFSAYPIPNTSISPNSLLAACLGSQYPLVASGADHYTWSPSTYLSCDTCANTIATATTNIEYYLNGITNFGCSKMDSIQVNVINPFTLTVTPPTDSVCSGQLVNLLASGANSYSWTPATGLNNPYISNPIAQPHVTTSYKVTATDSHNCFTDSGIVNITVFPIPTVNTGNNINITNQQSVTLSPLYSTDITSWLWTPSSGLSCTDCADPVASPTSSTTYTITVQNSFGCESSESISVYLPCVGRIYIPNTFSPNGDGVNDVFYIRGADISNILSFRIYDRWGELVFERDNIGANDISNGWNGTINGVKAQSDVYVYTAELVCNNKQTSIFKGNVTLIR